MHAYHAQLVLIALLVLREQLNAPLGLIALLEADLRYYVQVENIVLLEA